MEENQLQEQEIWKPIRGYEGFYEVSSLGRVRRVFSFISDKKGHQKPIAGGIIKPIANAGYLYVSLSKNGKAIRYAVHRVAAYAFLAEPKNKLDIDHINGIRTDNRIENLRWATKKENNNNPISRAKYLKSHCRSVERIDINGNVKYYKSIIDAEADGFNRGSIYRCCTGSSPLYKGFIWRYPESHNKDGMTVVGELEKKKLPRKRIDSHRVERRKNDEIKIYDKLRDVEADGFSYRSVAHCCLYPHRRKTSGGYQWRYLD